MSNIFDLERKKQLELTTAGVVELADAPDSKSGLGNQVGVQFSPPAPIFNITAMEV